MSIWRAFWHGVYVALTGDRTRFQTHTGWALGDADGDVHVLPFGDLIDHEVTNCACGPTIEPCPREDGSMGWLVTHHSLDGREASE